MQTAQQTLVDALELALRAGGGPVELFETHISWVLVARPWAYKIKKAVRLDFLDFTTLAARRHFCEEELRLNRRLAPRLYDSVVPVAGSVRQPVLGGEGEAIEYAVRMRAFDQDDLWTRRIERQVLGGAEVDELAGLLAAFHAVTACAPDAAPWGTPAALAGAARENIGQLARLSADVGLGRTVAELAEWQERRLRELWPLFAARKAGGFIRECHGDLHCGNILTMDGRVTVFDCIEFDEGLRWLDVLHDLAFACMDLRQRGQGGLAARLFDGYLAIGGDYAGAAALRYYEAQCALVRAKIALVRAAQADGPAGRACVDEAARLLATAGQAASPGNPVLVVMHGLTGSGKSTVARALVEPLGAVRLRSDVERKRMHGVAPSARLPPELYGQAASDAVYARLRALAAGLLQAGTSVVVDACNLKRHERAGFEAVAAEAGAPSVLLDVRAAESVMRERIRRRLRERRDPSDANEAVLDLQLRAHEPPVPGELARAVVVDGEAPLDAVRLAQAVAEAR